MAEKDVNWFAVDVDSMSPDLKKRYQALLKAQSTVKVAKADFEAAFTAAARKADRIDADVELAFGYRFGKLAIAKVESKASPKTSSKPKFTF